MSREASLLPPFIPPRDAGRWAIRLLILMVAVAWLAVGIDLSDVWLLVQALRASMRADRFLPVLWSAAAGVLSAAREAGRRIIAREDVGAAAPWEADLTGPVLFVVGGEHSGIPPEMLARCDAVVRIPMQGFIRSYNLQAAVAIAAAERLRQQARDGA